MKICVFLGPTMPVEAARAILPDAVYLPPVAQADVVSALHIHRPDVLALIDGVFGQSLAVWHKEILFALHEGVTVFGASSMGALRAVECAEYGMIGVGEVVRQYADGTLTEDDEVALAHAGPEDGFMPLSEPMVNLRASFRAARGAGVIDAALHDRLVAAAKRLYFPERARDRIWAEAGLTDAETARLDGFLATGYVDLKRRDAEALLHHLRDLVRRGVTALPPRVPFDFNRTHFFEVLYERDRRAVHGGHAVPLSSIANHAALHRADFAEINAAALGRILSLQLAELVGVTVDAAAVTDETRRFCWRRGITSAEALAGWKRRNDLTEAEFSSLMMELAVERAMRHWLIARRFMARTTRPVLNELRVRGLYEAVAEEAALVERVAELHFADFSRQPVVEMDRLVLDHIEQTDGRMDAHYTAWAYEAGFKDANDLRIDLVKARQVRDLFRRLADEAEAALREGETVP